MKNKVAVIILAAGKGERMKSELPKVLHPVCGRPMLEFVLDTVRDLKIKDSVIVLGHKHQEVSKVLRSGIKTVIQKKVDGTASAVKIALFALGNFKGTILVLYGDIPLLRKETIAKLIKHHSANDLDATLLTANVDKPQGYGRILRDKYNTICGIVEEKDADEVQKEIKEINTGIVCFKKDKLISALKQVKPNNRKKEYYLTDTFGIIYNNKGLLDSVKVCDVDEAMGINSRIELAKANRIMQIRINEELMKEGVSIVDPASTFINFGTKIGQDTTIYPFTVIEKGVKIGKCCSVGPFVHLREDVEIADRSFVGNFLEIARSKIGSGCFAKHFCYLGDSSIGDNVNIGAGVVIANFNGKKKNPTVIKDNAFIGSDSILVAPVKIGKSAKTGAGSVVIKDVSDNTTVVGIPARPIKK
ncbi:MAG: NTP transferase domain-containing protein [Candidatus Omnitrophica bacterium]|nr:NTP transferase domain-containing protein [Candidatus Omnitrophota bacterium]